MMEKVKTFAAYPFVIWSSLVTKTYNWSMRMAVKPHAMFFLAFVSFIESSFFPLPPDLLIIPMVLAARAKAWRIAAVCTVSSVIGGFLGYAIGACLYELIAEPILSFYGYLDKFVLFQDYYNEWGAWIVAGAGVTPFPYKVITIASGVTGLDLTVFTVASILSRGVRFFLVAALLWKFGAPVKVFIEKRLGLLATLFFILLFGSFVLINFIV